MRTVNCSREYDAPIDSWNVNNFDDALCCALNENSRLIAEYYCEDRRLKEEHLNSGPYESLKANCYSFAFKALTEQIITPMTKERRIRVWHYTRLTEDEATTMNVKITLSSLEGLKGRIDDLIKENLLSQQEGDVIYDSSPLQTQESIRADRFYAATTPKSADDPGVMPFLAKWGGESGCVCPSNEIY